MKMRSVNWLSTAVGVAVLVILAIALATKHLGSSHSAAVSAENPQNNEGAESRTNQSGSQTLASLLKERCEREGIRFTVVPVKAKTPQIHESVRNATNDSWQKLMTKLEARLGYVPIYGKGNGELTNAPGQITQIGPFVYMGDDEEEIRALKMLADGDLSDRSDALDVFDEHADHAVSLFLALQKKDPEAQIRIQATQKLQAHPSQRVIESLVYGLADDDEAVQTAARTSLVWIGDERVLTALRVAVNSDDEKISTLAQQILKENLEAHY